MPCLRPPLLRTICTLGLLCLLIGACRTDGPETTASETAGADTTRTETTGDTAATPSDSSVDPTAPPPAPAPGTARVRVEIRTCDTDVQPAHCQIRVDEVLGYGSSTPPLSTGDHTVRLSPSVLDDGDTTALGETNPQTVVLRHAGDQPDFGGDDSNEEQPAWTLQSIE